MGLPKPRIQWIYWGQLLQGKSGRGVKLTTHLQPVPRLRMSKLPSTSSWHGQGQLYHSEPKKLMRRLLPSLWLTISCGSAETQWLFCYYFTLITERMVLNTLEMLWTLALFCCDSCTALPQSTHPPRSNSSSDLFWNHLVPTATPFVETWELDDDCVAWIWMNGEFKWWWWHITLFHNW